MPTTEFSWLLKARLTTGSGDSSGLGYFTVRDYVPSPYPERTLLIRSGFGPQRVSDPEMGWSGLLVGKSEFQFVPGGHKRIFLEPNVDLLANTLKRCLSEAQNTENESELTTVNSMQEAK